MNLSTMINGASSANNSDARRFTVSLGLVEGDLTVNFSIDIADIVALISLMRGTE